MLHGHEAAHQLHEKALEIVLKAGADIKAKSQDVNHVAEEVFSTHLEILGVFSNFMRFSEMLKHVEATTLLLHVFARCLIIFSHELKHDSPSPPY